MFERLAGKLLSRLLSKYFVSNDSVSNGSGAPTSASRPRRRRHGPTWESGVDTCRWKVWNYAKRLSIAI